MFNEDLSHAPPHITFTTELAPLQNHQAYKRMTLLWGRAWQAKATEKGPSIKQASSHMRKVGVTSS